jgi:anti-anti-sigma factor
MELTTHIDLDADKSLARVALIGSLNTDTAPGFAARLDEAIAAGMELTVLDMAELEYISSAGLRVIFKAAKAVKEAGRKLAAANRKPHIDKVFEILKALPDIAVFADDDEMDDYLAAMQDQVRGQ